MLVFPSAIGIKKIERSLKELTSSGYTEKIQDVIVTSLIEQIDRGGPTSDMDVESMKEYGELAIRVDDVLELRTKEMQHQYIPVLKFDIDKESRDILESAGDSVNTHYADLRMLWLTDYGIEALESMKMRTTCEYSQRFRKHSQTLGTISRLFQIQTPIRLLAGEIVESCGNMESNLRNPRSNYPIIYPAK